MKWFDGWTLMDWWIRGPTRHPVRWDFPDGSWRVLSFEEME